MAFNSAPAYGSVAASSLAMPPPPPPFEMSAQDLVSMDSYDGFDTPPQYMASPTNKVALDLSKYKTKLCRHYLNGNACPFEDRCAFAHGHDEQAAARAAAQAAMPPPPPPPSYELHVSASSGNSSDVDGQETNSNMNLGGSREEESRPSTPPAYPSRFRYDPYSPSGIVYAQ